MDNLTGLPIFRNVINSHFTATFKLLIPLKGTSIGNYASIFHVEAYLVFGGYNGEDLSKIGRLDAETRKWSLAGTLKQARHGHAVVFDGDQFLVIGGYGDRKTENCVLTGDTISCTEQQNELHGYYYYPELMLVDVNYGEDC